MTIWQVKALVFVVAAVAVALAALPAWADDQPKKEPPKLPPLDAKEWKKQDNGLQVWDVKDGSGEAAKADSMITIHYTGWLTNGKVFDSSVTGGEPITFPLDGL